MNILSEIIKLDKNEYFYYPVDTNNVKNYLKIINNPICFSDVVKKLDKNFYLENIDEFFYDIRLIFNNATNFNMPASTIYKYAVQVQAETEQILTNKKSELFYLSFEFYIFDNNQFEILFSQNNELFLKNLEEIIISKFSDKFEILRLKFNSFVNKLNEYRINWHLIRNLIDIFLK